MNRNDLKHEAFVALRKVMHSYSSLLDSTWQSLIEFCDLKKLSKQQVLYPSGSVPSTFAFLYSGLIRGFIGDEDGNEYNKIFFDEGTFPGSMAALLTSKPAQFTFEALEPSLVITINFAAYRNLLNSSEDLKLYHIHYLEKNWLLAKEAREVEIVQEDATQRYRRFLEAHPTFSSRIPQYHIASHLGITPTQLSRIRKKTSTYQPM